MGEKTQASMDDEVEQQPLRMMNYLELHKEHN
jgi:hypothetical protein